MQNILREIDSADKGIEIKKNTQVYLEKLKNDVKKK
jgi:hypothetical protein